MAGSVARRSGSSRAAGGKAYGNTKAAPSPKREAKSWSTQHRRQNYQEARLNAETFTAAVKELQGKFNISNRMATHVLWDHGFKMGANQHFYVEPDRAQAFIRKNRKAYT